MQIGKVIGLCMWVLACATAAASTASPGKLTGELTGAFTGAFSGTGRACNGTLHVRSKTIEWRSSFSVCRRGAYKVLEQRQTDGRPQIAFRLKARAGKCLYEVLSLNQVDGTDWTAHGYPSLQAFRQRAEPGWRDASVPERLVLECPMTQWR